MSIVVGSKKTVRWFLVVASALVAYLGFTALSFLTSIYQLSTFLNLSLVVYLFLVLLISFIFDLRLKVPESWKRSAYYYHHVKHRPVKIAKIFFRAFILRFHYLKSGHHWRSFQNYLILPSILYWSVVILIFLNPFEAVYKQIFIITGTLLFGIIIWFLKVVFVNYSVADINARYLMFAATVIAGFLGFSADLGITWYLGMSKHFFVFSVFCVAALLMFQSLYHHALLDILKNFRYVLLGALICAAAAYAVAAFWTVNYFSGGLLLAGLLHLYWSLVLQWRQGRLTWLRAFDYVLVFLFVALFVFATTNFHARIG